MTSGPVRSTRILPDRPLSPPGPGRLEKVAVGLVGIAAFLVFVGHRALIPDNIAWLDFGDPAQHFLGWHFFRFAPWTFPPGLNPPYGLEVSSSIVYSDSIPLLALLLKPLSAVLPPVFQYFGFWLLACFMLQAWFGWKLAGLLTRQPVARVLVATLFATALPMVERTHHHLALSGHFILLAALYLALRPVRRHQDGFWALLLVTAALVNAYLLVMAAALWASDLASRLILRREDWRRLVLPAVATIAAILLALWLAGYFSEGEPGTAGFGLFRFNLLSLVDSGRWSSLVPDIPGGPGDPEGFAFLGLGGLALAAVAIAMLATGRAGIRRPAARFPFLLAVLALLAIYAMSNEIGIGPLSLFVPLPPAVAELTGVFRASGRMIWPAYYALLLAIAYLVLRGTGRRLAVPLLALALVVQLADFLGPWWAERTRMMAEPSSRWETKLDDPFWEAAASRYVAVRRIVPVNVAPSWQDVSYYAATHRMGTDMVYLARLGHERAAKAQRAARKAVKTGQYRADSLYVVAPEYLLAAARSLDRSRDVLASVDDQYVVAPGWRTCDECPSLGESLRPDQLLPLSARGVPIVFGSEEPTAWHLLRGWSWPEPWGVWSSARRASVILRVAPEVQSVTVRANAFTPAPLTAQRVVVTLNGIEAARADVPGNGIVLELPLTDEIRKTLADGYLTIDFRLPDAISPLEAGMSGDARRLALGLLSVTPN